MSKRADQLRRRIAKRKAQRDRMLDNQLDQKSDGRKTGNSNYPKNEGISTDEYASNQAPLWNRDVFILKVLLSACLLIGTAIMFKSPTGTFEAGRTFVKNTFEQEFQFATVADWYERQFGKPLALFPTDLLEGVTDETVESSYALPASGKVVTNFSKDGRGILIETGNSATVEAMNGGVVIFAGKKKEIGNTVILQHADKSESWYGNLEKIEVKQYERIESGKTVGTVLNKDDETVGMFYFAIKKDNEFIDPNQVINFE